MRQNYTEQKKITTYDKREIFEKKVLPSVNTAMSLCSSLGIPAFMTFAVENSDKGTVYERKIVHAVAREELKDDVLASLLLKINGFNHSYPEYIKDAVRTISEYLDRQQSYDIEILEPDKSVILQNDEIIEFSNFIGGNYEATSDPIPNGSDDSLILFR